MTQPLALWVVFAACVTAVCAITFITTNINLYLLKEKIMATLQEAVDGWKSYTTDLKAQRDAAVAALDEANTRAAAAAQALADFQANDAETDASQLAAQAQSDADFVQGALDEVKNPPAEPPVITEPVDETPVDEPAEPTEEPTV